MCVQYVESNSRQSLQITGLLVQDNAKANGFGTKIHYRAERDPITGRFISTK